MTSISANDTVKRLDAMIANYVSALEKLPSSQRLSESSLTTVYAMAGALQQSGQLPQASAYFSFLLLYAPTHPDYLCARASCAIQQSDPQMAVDLLSLALYVKPQSCAIALALVDALIATDATDAARHILQQVCRLAQPEDATLLARAELLLQTLTAQAPHAAT